MSTQKLVFCYACDESITFSGQRIATEMLIKGLLSYNWEIVEIRYPALNRIGYKNQYNFLYSFQQILLWLFKLILAWIHSSTYVFTSEIIYVNLSQSTVGIIRDGFPLLIRSLFYYNGNGIISLHGSLFMQWTEKSFCTKFLKFISTRGVKHITVLGPSHRNQLLKIGIPSEKIILMDNSCLLNPLTKDNVVKKHQLTTDSFNKKTVKILYLSSLMEAKGYIDFVEAINYLSKLNELDLNNIFLEVNLCGQIKSYGTDFRFNNNIDARSWLEEQIIDINKSSSVKICWIDGIAGKPKEKMFYDSQIFVLPSRYKVEAQPISILEALASGCAIISTKIGEISTTLDNNTSILINETTPKTISGTIMNLCNNHELRTRLAVNGNSLFQQRFSYKVHIEKWNTLLNSFCV